MNKKDLLERTEQLLREESSQPDGLWWLSFAGDDGFLGVAIVRARGFVTAVETARALGCNPGGEVQGRAVPDDVVPYISDTYKNRLLSREDCAAVEAEGQKAFS